MGHRFVLTSMLAAVLMSACASPTRTAPEVPATEGQISALGPASLTSKVKQPDAVIPAGGAQSGVPLTPIEPDTAISVPDQAQPNLHTPTVPGHTGGQLIGNNGGGFVGGPSATGATASPAVSPSPTGSPTPKPQPSSSASPSGIASSGQVLLQ